MGDRALIAHVADAAFPELHNNSSMKTKWCLSVGSVLVSLCIGAQVSIVMTEASAANESGIYYVDSQNGSDAAPGNSPSRAWRSLGRVNAMMFHAGDRILLRAGRTWTGQLWP